MKQFSVKSTFLSITTKLIVVSMFTINLYATSFSGYAGIAALPQYVKDDDGDYDGSIPIQSFLTGQLELSNFLILRGEISFRPSYLSTLLNDTETDFRINELSGTVRVNTDYFAHYLALFMGRYESIGSDVFMQRHFGIKPFTSKLLENWRGTAEPAIYDFKELGLSYIIQPSTNFAGGFYFYNYKDERTIYYDKDNKDKNENKDMNVINADLRFAFTSYMWKLDFSGGIGIPMGESNIGNSDNAVFSIQSIDAHFGTNMLFTLSEKTDLFLQIGLKRFSFYGKDSPTAKFDDAKENLKNLVFLLEPRFAIKDNAAFTISLFQLPINVYDNDNANKIDEDKSKSEDFFFLHGNLGVDFAYSRLMTIFGNTDVELGSHLTAALHRQYISTLDSLSKESSEDDNENEYKTRTTDYSLSPFMNITLGKGTFKSAISIDIQTEYSGSPTVNAFFMLGYRTSF